jgi:hypothetical protein
MNMNHPTGSFFEGEAPRALLAEGATRAPILLSAELYASRQGGTGLPLRKADDE